MYRLKFGRDVFVLIETYWNVNKIERRKWQISLTVLIETYWNVNE